MSYIAAVLHDKEAAVSIMGHSAIYIPPAGWPLRHAEPGDSFPHFISSFPFASLTLQNHRIWTTFARLHITRRHDRELLTLQDKTRWNVNRERWK
jgi:hypothetical protein